MYKVKVYSLKDQPEAETTPFTPTPSSLLFSAISWSEVTNAEAANWALAASIVFDTKLWDRKKKTLMDKPYLMIF